MKMIWQKKYDNQPCDWEIENNEVPVNIHGIQLKALLDSGANVNAISPKFLENHPKLKKYVSVNNTKAKCVTTARSSEMIPMSSVVTLNVLMFQRQFRVKFYVVDNL